MKSFGPVKAVNCSKGGKERNETNLIDKNKSTTVVQGPGSLVIRKRKQKKEMNLSASHDACDHITTELGLDKKLTDLASPRSDADVVEHGDEPERITC